MLTATVCFGRFQPPHLGHRKIIERMSREFESDKFLFASRKEDHTNNILNFDLRNRILRKACDFVCDEQTIFSPFSLLLWLNGKYDNVNFVCGADRASEFKYKMERCNGSVYSFDSINIIPIPRSAESYSGTEMRSLAITGDFEKFRKHFIVNDVTLAEEVFYFIRRGFNVGC